MATVLKAGHAVYGVGLRAAPGAAVSSWAPRYVVLTGTCICAYPSPAYPSPGALHKPLACVVIIPDTSAEIVTESKAASKGAAGGEGRTEFRVFVNDPAGNHFTFVLGSAQEQLAWVDAVRRAIRLSRFALKAYITTTLRKGILATKQRRYFVLDSSTLHRHRDYDRVWETEAQFRFQLCTRTLYSDDSNTISLRNRGPAAEARCGYTTTTTTTTTTTATLW
jgi:hypothetical protein